MSLTALLPTVIPGLAVLSASVARVAAGGLSFAAMLADPAGAVQTVSPPSGKPELSAELQMKLGQFAAMLKERLEAMGRSLSGTVELSADILGGIKVRGEEQNVQTVEQLLAQDEDLSASYFQLASAFNQAMGKTNADTHSLPWDVAGAARGVKMVVGERGAELVAQ